MTDRDIIDDVLDVDKYFMKKHAMNAYLSFVNNNCKRGVYLVEYDKLADAVSKHDYIYGYITDVDHIITLMKKIDITCLKEVYDMYDETMQVVLVIIINKYAFLKVETYSSEDIDNWLKHYECHRRCVL